MDKKKWERWINNSAESVDWMIDKMEAKGLHVCLEPGYYDPDGVLTVPSASHNFWNEEQPFGALFGAPLQAQALSLIHILDSESYGYVFITEDQQRSYFFSQSVQNSGIDFEIIEMCIRDRH